jgi:hypothetical protein
MARDRRAIPHFRNVRRAPDPKPIPGRVDAADNNSDQKETLVLLSLWAITLQIIQQAQPGTGFFIRQLHVSYDSAILCVELCSTIHIYLILLMLLGRQGIFGRARLPGIWVDLG